MAARDTALCMAKTKAFSCPGIPVVGMGLGRPSGHTRSPVQNRRMRLRFQLRPDTVGPLRVAASTSEGVAPVHAHVLVGRGDHYRAPEGTGGCRAGDGRTSRRGALRGSISWLELGKTGMSVRAAPRVADASPAGEHGLCRIPSVGSADDGYSPCGGLRTPKNPFPGKDCVPPEPDDSFCGTQTLGAGIGRSVHGGFWGPIPPETFRAEGTLGKHGLQVPWGTHGAGLCRPRFSPELVSMNWARASSSGFPMEGG